MDLRRTYRKFLCRFENPGVTMEIMQICCNFLSNQLCGFDKLDILVYIFMKIFDISGIVSSYVG